MSLAARLAMLAQDHQTTTSEPAGDRHPSDMEYGRAMITGQAFNLSTASGNVGLNKPGRRAGKMYYRDSVAACACRWSYPAEDRDHARRKAHEHRQEVTAAMIRGLGD